MGFDGVGSSVIIVLAALLWLAYLVPSWLRRREYLSTERNALRLQQTLRIMAESAEVPEQIRAETTARSAAHHEKLLRKQEQRAAAVLRAQDAATARNAARRLAELQPALAADVAVTSMASRRLRRSRAITSLVLLFSLAATGVGAFQFATVGSWTIGVVGIAVATGSLVMLGQMAAVSRARVQLAHGLRERPRVAAPVVVEASASAPVAASTWTPVPVPKPLYLNRPQIDRSVDASLEAAAELRQAAADAERRLREALEQPEVTPIRRPAPAPAAAPSRFARMGYVDAADTAATDLDAVLARRRA
jgi:hypothetical protein